MNIVLQRISDFGASERLVSVNFLSTVSGAIDSALSNEHAIPNYKSRMGRCAIFYLMRNIGSERTPAPKALQTVLKRGFN